MENILQELFSGNFARALCLTLLHSLWQAALMALMAMLLMSVTRKAAAVWRYVLLLWLFGVLIIGALVTFFIVLGDIRQQGSALGPIVAGLPALLARVAAYSHYILPAWAGIFIIKLFRLYISGRQIHVLKGTAVPATGWNTTMESLCSLLDIKQRVRLYESKAIKSPVTIGFLKPVIFVPLGMLMHLPPEQAEAALLHELAHIKRKDYLINLVQLFTEAIFFFNPAVLWLSHIIRREREACCDAMVLQHRPAKKTYLRSLLAFEEMGRFAPATALGLAGKAGLADRVNRIVTNSHPPMQARDKIRMILFLLLLALLPALNKSSVMHTGKVIGAEELKPAQVVANAPAKPSPGQLSGIALTPAPQMRHEARAEQAKANKPQAVSSRARRAHGKAKASAHVTRAATLANDMAAQMQQAIQLQHQLIMAQEQLKKIQENIASHTIP